MAIIGFFALVLVMANLSFLWFIFSFWGGLDLGSSPWYYVLPTFLILVFLWYLLFINAPFSVSIRGDL